MANLSSDGKKFTPLGCLLNQILQPPLIKPVNCGFDYCSFENYPGFGLFAIIIIIINNFITFIRYYNYY